MNELLHIWLIEVPDYAVIFTQWMIVCQIIGTFNVAFYIPMMAANKIKSNSMAAAYLGIGQFVLLYILLKIGFGIMWVQYIHLFMMIGFAMVVKPYILYKEIDYSFKELFACYWACAKVLLLSLAISIPICYYLNHDLIGSIVKVLIVGSSVLFSSYLFLDRGTKHKLQVFVKEKIKICK